VSAGTSRVKDGINREKSSFKAASRICEYSHWISRLALTLNIEDTIKQSYQGEHPEMGFDGGFYAEMLKPVQDILSVVETYDPSCSAVKRDLVKFHGFSEIGAETLVDSFKGETDLGASLLERVQDSKSGLYHPVPGVVPWLASHLHTGE
jgi:hypothetical protein